MALAKNGHWPSECWCQLRLVPSAPENYSEDTTCDLNWTQEAEFRESILEASHSSLPTQFSPDKIILGLPSAVQTPLKHGLHQVLVSVLLSNLGGSLHSLHSPSSSGASWARAVSGSQAV